MDPEPTHHLPPELQAKLIEAKRWHEEREALETAIGAYGGIAERNQEDRDTSDRTGAAILADVVEIMDREWGFVESLPRTAP